MLRPVCHGGNESSPNHKFGPCYRGVALATDHARPMVSSGSPPASTDCPFRVIQCQQGCTVARVMRGQYQVQCSPVCIVPNALLAHSSAPSALGWRACLHQRRHCCPVEKHSSTASLACDTSVHGRGTGVLRGVCVAAQSAVAPNDLEPLVGSVRTLSHRPQQARPCGGHHRSIPALPPVCEEVQGASGGGVGPTAPEDAHHLKN